MRAVLTGDIVDFTKMEGKDRERVLNSLKNSFRRLGNDLKYPGDSMFDIFRGDSFQGVIEHPAKALRAMLFIRSSLRADQPQDSPMTWDVRMAVGVGSVDSLGDRPSEGDGQAFRLSGPALDAMKLHQRMVLQTPWERINNEFEVSFALTDAVISKWSPKQAEIAVQLLQRRSRKTIAHELGISQAAVSYRVQGAGWFAIEKLLTRYREEMQDKVSAKDG
jgi:hypothetical protein